MEDTAGFFVDGTAGRCGSSVRAGPGYGAADRGVLRIRRAGRPAAEPRDAAGSFAIALAGSGRLLPRGSVSPPSAPALPPVAPSSSESEPIEEFLFDEPAACGRRSACWPRRSPRLRRPPFPGRPRPRLPAAPKPAAPAVPKPVAAPARSATGTSSRQACRGPGACHGCHSEARRLPWPPGPQPQPPKAAEPAALPRPAPSRSASAAVLRRSPASHRSPSARCSCSALAATPRCAFCVRPASKASAPVRVRIGEAVTLTGKNFSRRPDRNVVMFNDKTGARHRGLVDEPEGRGARRPRDSGPRCGA